MTKTIAFVTTSRADYGYVMPVMRALREEGSATVKLFVTGSHLELDYGKTILAIEADGFRADERIAIHTSQDDASAAAKAMARALEGFSDALSRSRPDLLVVMGDRYEMLAAAQAALLHKVPVAHLAGGDITEGAFDESARHALTKLAHLHLVTNEPARRRVIQMGEDPARVFCAGSTSLDLLETTPLLDRKSLEKTLGTTFLKRNVLVAFHPETLSRGSSVDLFLEIIRAIEALGPDVGIFVTKPNADPESRALIVAMEEWASRSERVKLYDSLGALKYWSLMKQVDVAVGNSSSLIYEAPSLGTVSVNVGDRQKGRLAAASVMHAACRKAALVAALRTALRRKGGVVENPYYGFQAARTCARLLAEFARSNPSVQKRFHSAPLKKAFRRAYLIAEAGVNHNGDLATAKRLIEEAARCGADAVKFQTFRAESLASAAAPMAAYQRRNTGKRQSQRAMLEALELSAPDHRALLAHARRKKIDFLSSPFDIGSVRFLAKLGVERIKVPSGELTNAPYLIEVAKTGRPVLLSTGMSTLDEVRKALSVLAYVWACPERKAGREAFHDAFYSLAGQSALRKRVTLLHAVTDYPVKDEDSNLSAIVELERAFGLPVGYSDHTLGLPAALGARVLGAVVIEKHFTLDRAMKGPDHLASLDRTGFTALVREIRRLEKMIGSGDKTPRDCEWANRRLVRKSLVASKAIRRGEVFTKLNLSAKRPGEGLSPFLLWDLIGQKAGRAYRSDERIRS